MSSKRLLNSPHLHKMRTLDTERIHVTAQRARTGEELLEETAQMVHREVKALHRDK
jgi:hypothetical protein